MWVLKKQDEFVFKHPFRCYVAGPTFSGKTKLIEKILLNQEDLIDKKFDRIVFCYKTMQSSYEIYNYLDTPVEFIEGLIDFNEFDASKNNLLIIDDLMDICKDKNEVLTLFTVYSHHKSISVFLVSQNIFSKGKCSRDINLNSSNMIIFKQPRDKVQISVLARQMFPNNSKALLEAFDDATSKNHGYLFLDFNQSTSENLRIQTDITERPRIIYTFNEKN
jgi:hypothetical protein